MIEEMKLSAIKPNPNNPRLIKDEKFTKLCESLRSFPQMLRLRPVVINEAGVIIGGNMRYKAAKEIGMKTIPVMHAKDLTPEQEREFIIKDNVGFGEWDWETLANEWDSEKLEEWGVDVPGIELDADKLSDAFTLPDGDKAPFQQMTFTLADEQAQHIKNAIEDIKSTQEYKYVETFGNENSNGNALYLIISEWAGQRK